MMVCAAWDNSLPSWFGHRSCSFVTTMSLLLAISSSVSSFDLNDSQNYLTPNRSLASEGDDHGDDEHGFGVHVEYDDLYAAMIFIAAVYVGGKLSSMLLKMPGLVGEIFTGIILGPPLLDYVPYPEAFVLFGEIGLILLVLEAGIDIDLVTLKLVGSRGCLIAVIGSFAPIVIAFAVALAIGSEVKEAIAAGASFGPTSLGIALNILRAGNVLNTPTGQMIIAAAIIDDMIALVILSQLSALSGDVTVEGIVIPVVSALGFLVIGGYLAIAVLPQYVDQILEKFPPERGGFVSTGLMFSLLYVMIPATKESKASYLMGAFIAGLLFCSDHDLHHNFVSQFKRIMQWLIRIFFAASIGFQVPVKDFGDGEVIWKGLLFTLALLGKLGVGFLVPNFSSDANFRGGHLKDCLIVGFSMMAEGEFAFVIAVYAADQEIITEKTYASVVLAILLSTVIAPFCLRYTITTYASHKESKVAEIEALTPESDNKSLASWGLFSNILKVLQELQLDVVDHRSWHPHGDEYLANEMYLKDSGFHGDCSDAEALESRLSTIESAILAVINQPDATVQVGQWKVIKEEDDANEKVSNFDFVFREARRQLDKSTHVDSKVLPTQGNNDANDFWNGGETGVNAMRGSQLRHAPVSRMRQSSYDINRASGARPRRIKQCSHNIGGNSSVARFQQFGSNLANAPARLSNSDGPRSSRRRQVSMPIGTGINDATQGILANVVVGNKQFLISMEEATFEAIKKADTSNDLDKIVLKHVNLLSVESELGGFIRRTDSRQMRVSRAVLPNSALPVQTE